ncbi:MAG: AAA family ATPase [Caldimicrobium sp.]
MYIKRLEIYGFKSFPYKISLNFSKGITAIVGPNGAGKSNVLDAIKWVLGEQSPKRLRIKDLSELIYSGNTDRKIDFAEVKLVLAHEPPILEKYKDFEEISIIRRYYRDGESEFYINNKPCRLKDIHFLFLDMGINPQSYGIIDQGEIYKFLEISPKERRKFLEDLAGISKFKIVQEEVEKNLQLTENNLLRITDVIKEVEKQYFHLKEQSEKAKKYLSLKEELKNLLIQKNYYLYKNTIKKKEVYLNILNDYKKQKSEINEKLNKLEREETKFYQEISKKEKHLKEHKKTFIDYNNELKKIDEQLRELYKKEGILANNKEKEEMKYNFNLKRKDEILKELTEIEKVLNNINTKEDTIKKNLEDIKRKKEEKEKILKEELDKLNKINDEYNKKEKEFLKLKENIKIFLKKRETDQKEIDLIDKELKKCQINLEALKKEKNSLENQEREINSNIKKIEDSLKLILAEINKIDEKILYIHKEKENYLRELSGIEANLKLINELTNKEEKEILTSYINRTIGANLEVSSEELTLLEYFYNDYLKSIIVRDFNEIESIIKEQNVEDISFILIDALKNIPLKIMIKDSFDKQPCADEKNFIYYNDKKLLITPQGFILYLPKKKKRGYFSLKKEKEILSKKVEEIKSKIENLKKREESLIERKKELEERRQLFSKELNQINHNITTIKEKYKKIELERVKFSEKINHLNLRKSDLTKSIQDTSLMLEDYKKKYENFEIYINQLKSQKLYLEKLINQIKSEIIKLEEKIINIEKEIIVLKTERNNLITRKNNLQIEFEKVEKIIKVSFLQIEKLNSEIIEIKQKLLEMKKLKDEFLLKTKEIEPLIINLEEEINKLNDNIKNLYRTKKEYEEMEKQLEIKVYNIELKIAEINLILEKLNDEKKELLGTINNNLNINIECNLNEINNRIEEIKRELAHFEDINLASIKEFELISERYHNLLNQKKDLEKAIYDLNELLKDLKEKAKKQLKETLNKVNQKLEEIFPLIMDKGKAELFFTEEDPLTAGLDLKISLPHKKIQHLNILSGGEKALCVIALLMAFYLTKPGPFCILDEVDAPLDEKNSLKFINLLKRIKENSQIILITHNPNVMKEVDSLFGVTMEEKGVSKIVKLELDRYFK